MKTKLSKTEIADIRDLKEVQVGVDSMCCIDLNNNNLEILGTHFSCNEKLKEEKIFVRLADIQRVLKIMKMRNLAL